MSRALAADVAAQRGLDGVGLDDRLDAIERRSLTVVDDDPDVEVDGP